ncbi:MAG: cytochrome c oxidase accessory protein CcoG [Gammaproteobacteria bacterium]|nr:cytochrome c oxidase accessory protein CcoG [Gammaproteobacteria bacterium]MCP5459514.1 cytochrome c oxidase accessory protein CcoG [Gammaproteobacteria bacterium]
MSELAEQTLYQKRIPIYPRSVKGRFRNLKYGILVLAYGVYFLLPWVRWERANAPDQAVLFDLPGRHFYIFGLSAEPQDIIWLGGLLVIAAMLLFFVTGIAGRVFCGYFCFQTLWTDVFILIERWIQGERPARIRLGKSPWNRDKLVKMTATYGLWLLTAFWTGLTFTLYWGDAPALIGQFFSGDAPFAAYATTLFLTGTTFVMAGLAREQVCTYMCPYARFQSAMFDKDTLIVAYDATRGEGQNGRRKLSKELKSREDRHAQGIGDCIECGYCVQVCPTGIDIRNGLQLQCISCALCVDACDAIMDQLHWPRGLVKYTSDTAKAGQPTRIIKPKTIGYGVVLCAAIAALTWSIMTSASYTATVEQIRQPLFVTLSDGRIQNTYEIKLNNKVTKKVTFKVEVDKLPSAELHLEGLKDRVTLNPQQRLRVLARVRMPPPGIGENQHHYEFVITPIEGIDAPPVREPTVFYTP